MEGDFPLLKAIHFICSVAFQSMPRQVAIAYQAHTHYIHQ